MNRQDWQLNAERREYVYKNTSLWMYLGELSLRCESDTSVLSDIVYIVNNGDFVSRWRALCLLEVHGLQYPEIVELLEDYSNGSTMIEDPDQLLSPENLLGLQIVANSILHRKNNPEFYAKPEKTEEISYVKKPATDLDEWFGAAKAEPVGMKQLPLPFFSKTSTHPSRKPPMPPTPFRPKT